jgi:hypothetical protein
MRRAKWPGPGCWEPPAVAVRFFNEALHGDITMRDENATSDLSPSSLNIYGYMVVCKRDGAWVTESDDEYSNLPAHYPFMQQALDRAVFLRSKGITCRVSALLAEPTDSHEDFEAHRVSE